MAPQLDREGLDEALPGGIAAVLLNAPDGMGRPALRIDNRAGIDAVMAHLAATGRCAPVHVAGTRGNIDAEERRAAFANSVARRWPGTPVRILEGDFREETGAAAAAMLRGARDRRRHRGCQRHDGAGGASRAAKRGRGRTGRDRGHRLRRRAAGALPVAHHVARPSGRDRRARAVARLAARLTGEDEREDTDLIIPELIVRATSAARRRPRHDPSHPPWPDRGRRPSASPARSPPSATLAAPGCRRCSTISSGGPSTFWERTNAANGLAPIAGRRRPFARSRRPLRADRLSYRCRTRLDHARRTRPHAGDAAHLRHATAGAGGERDRGAQGLLLPLPGAWRPGCASARRSCRASTPAYCSSASSSPVRGSTRGMRRRRRSAPRHDHRRSRGLALVQQRTRHGVDGLAPRTRLHRAGVGRV
ncbi:hypothetical protein AB5I41_24015 [Sphingomonas sp. MMS24-JH45]